MSGDLDAILELGDFPWSAPTAPGDPYFDNVVLLMHCDGVDGANTFIDSSKYNRLLTAHGGVQTQAVSAKFGSAGLHAVNNPTPNIDYVDTGSAPELQLSGDFTFECFVSAAGGNREFFMVAGTGTYSLLCGYGDYVANKWGASFRDSLGGNYQLASTSNYPNLVYTHYAVTLSGTTLRLFINGVLEASTIISSNRRVDNAYVSVGSCNINYGLVGSLDEVRLTTGVARYTSSFTVPTSAFPGAILPATPGGGIVFPISGSLMKSIGTSSGVIIPADVSLTFNPNGTVQWVDYSNTYPDLPTDVNGLTKTFNWVYPNQIDTGSVTAPGASYWIRCVPISGGVPGVTNWTPLTSLVKFELNNVTSNPITEKFDIQIASDSNGNNIVCDSTGWTFESWTLGGASIGIVNPLIGGTFSTSAPPTRQAIVSVGINPNGTYGFYINAVLSGGIHNWYSPTINTAPFVTGYYIKITTISGALTTNDAATIQRIGSSASIVASLINIVSGTTKTTQFKIEIFSDAAGTILVSSGLVTFNAIVT